MNEISGKDFRILIARLLAVDWNQKNSEQHSPQDNVTPEQSHEYRLRLADASFGPP
jgi:hypothetical protein